MTYNKKSLGPLITFLFWLVLLFMVCLAGISNVFAAEYNLNSNYIQVYYDNNGSSVTSVGQTWVESLQSYISNNITTTAGSYGAGVAFNSPIPILANHNYSISIFFPELNNIALSSKNKITIGNSASSVSYNYTHNDYWVTQNYSNISNNSIISYNFTANGDASYIFIPWTTTTTTTQDYFFNQIIIEDLGSEGVSEATINNSINNQTNILNNYIQSSTNTITGALTDTENNINSNIDDMEQTIVDGNKETQEVIKDQFNTCRDSYNLFNENIYTNSSTNGYSLKNLEVGKNYTISINNNPNNSNYGFLIKDGAGSALTSDMWEQYTNKSVTFTYTQAMYDNDYKLYIIDTVNYAPISVDTLKSLKIQLQKGTTSLDYDPYGEKVCTNKIDDTNSKLDDVNNSLNDDSVDSSLANSFFDSFSSTDHGGISGIITAPLVAIKKMLDKNCSPLSATYKGEKIELPCGYDFWAKMPAIKEFINLTLGGLLCYNIIRKLFKLIESMKNPDDDRVEVMKL